MTAPGYGCQYCEGARPVNWLITHLSPAVTISVCDEDFPVAMIPVIGGELGVDGGELYGVVEAFVNGQAAAEAAEAGTVTPPQEPGPATSSGSDPGPGEQPSAESPTSPATKTTRSRARPAVKK